MHREGHPQPGRVVGKPPQGRVPYVPAKAEQGRGLRLVQDHADSWGGLSLGDGGPLDRGAGKLLWFEVGEC